MRTYMDILNEANGPRPAGHYWVQRNRDFWEVGYFDGTGWMMPGLDVEKGLFPDDHMHVIGQYLPEPK